MTEEHKQNTDRSSRLSVVEEEVHLWDYFLVVLRRWKIALTVFVVVFCAVALYTLFQKPVYEAFSTIEIRKGAKGGVLGAMGLESKDNLAADIQLLRSRSMAEKVVEGLHLQWQRINGRNGFEFVLRQFSLPEQITECEIILTGPDSYRVLLSGQEIAAGRSGEMLRTEDLLLLATIHKGKAGDRVLLQRLPLSLAISQVMNAVKATEVGRGTNILRLSAQSHDPRLARDMVNLLAQNYYEQSSGQNSQEAGKTVNFIEDQLAGLRGVLNSSEQQLKEYKIDSGLITLGPEGSRLIDQLVVLEQQKAVMEMDARRLRNAIDSLRQALAEKKSFSPPVIENVSAEKVIGRLGDLETEKRILLADFTEQHPAVKEVLQKIQQVQESLLVIYQTALKSLLLDIGEADQSRARFNAELRKVPEAELELTQMTRDNKVNAEIYSFLLQKQQEARIAMASTISNVEIIDPAFIPHSPIRPNKKKNLLLGAVLGLMIGIGLVFFLDYMDQTINDSEGASRALGLPVLGIIPRIDMVANRRGTGLLVSKLPPRSAPVEAFRSLRTSIHFAAAGEVKKVIMLTSALPGEGKSTTAANVALLLAQTGANVLLVGCDLRRPALAEIFGVDNLPGLTDLLTGTASEAICSLPRLNIDLLTGGTVPPNPAELLGSAQMHKFLVGARDIYDYVVLDAPPVLPVTDAQVLAPQADMVLIVLEACRMPVKAAQKMRQDLGAVNAPLAGVVLNDKSGKGATYYGGYGYYSHKEYGSYYAEQPAPRKRV